MPSLQILVINFVNFEINYQTQKNIDIARSDYKGQKSSKYAGEIYENIVKKCKWFLKNDRLG